MKSTTLTWEQTLAALLPLVGSTVWATVYVGDWPNQRLQRASPRVVDSLLSMLSNGRR